MTTLGDLRKAYTRGGIDKKVYWQIARENYLHVLPEIQEVIANNDEVDSVTIKKDGVILRKKSGVLNYFDFRQSISRAEADILLEGDSEHEDFEYIVKFLSNKNNCIIFDIGANVGIFSLELYQSIKDASFYLFEPIPSTYDWLIKNAKLNDVDLCRYKPFNTGMSNKKGTFDFFVPSANEAASLVANEDKFYRKKADIYGNYTGNTEIDKVQCKVSTVDSFVEEHRIDNITLIKIDVEGNEKFVLEGAIQSLKKFHPLVYCELLRKHAKRFGYHPNDVINFMNSLKYQCYVLKNGILENIDKITDQTIETNFFFV